ncbi:R3H domain-containing protein 2-like, partial [Bombina bombina]|uniref:R3H domain-containing protein 2-like n=1 Tax=Bombina bombina TaxID=8345 RepID=UPI00235A59BF
MSDTGSQLADHEDGCYNLFCTMLKMSHGHSTQETLEIMKESEKRLVEESVNRSKSVSRSPSKEEQESDETNSRQEPQVIVPLCCYNLFCTMLKMSHGHSTQETLEIMKESEKRLVEESVNRSKSVSRSPSKEEQESDETNSRQEPQRRNPSHGHARKRAKSNSKLKLVRSLAVCEESSGPFMDGTLESQVPTL